MNPSMTFTCFQKFTFTNSDVIYSTRNSKYSENNPLKDDSIRDVNNVSFSELVTSFKELWEKNVMTLLLNSLNVIVYKQSNSKVQSVDNKNKTSQYTLLFRTCRNFVKFDIKDGIQFTLSVDRNLLYFAMNLFDVVYLIFRVRLQ